MQFPKKLRPRSGTQAALTTASLNEVQFPKKLRHQPIHGQDAPGAASMKFSSRRNRDSATTTASRPAATACLNEVQFPKELQHHRLRPVDDLVVASMKCSPRKNYDAIIVYAETNGHKPQ